MLSVSVKMTSVNHGIAFKLSQFSVLGTFPKTVLDFFQFCLSLCKVPLGLLSHKHKTFYD